MATSSGRPNEAEAIWSVLHPEGPAYKEDMAESLAQRLRSFADSLVAVKGEGEGEGVGSRPAAKPYNSPAATESPPSSPPGKKQKKKKTKTRQIDDEQKRGPDFSKASFVHLAIKVAYFGWNYYGFARLKDLDQTVEAKLFKALCKCRLIPPGSDPSAHVDLDYSRCGRTDKGVSASGQVVALKVRSSPNSNQEPLDYAAMINRYLPDDIRVLGCCEMDSSFHARFSAGRRHYKYFFLRGVGQSQACLEEEIKRIETAAAHFVGEHDFRNFCKASDSVESYVRTIHECYVERLAEGESGTTFAVNVVGSAFLWHQVRCMVSILFSVGEGKLQADAVKKYLNIVEQPVRPSYTMAPEEPLLLYHCTFDQPVHFTISPYAARKLTCHLETLLHDLHIRMQLLKEVLKLVPSL